MKSSKPSAKVNKPDLVALASTTGIYQKKLQECTGAKQDRKRVSFDRPYREPDYYLGNNTYRMRQWSQDYG